MWNGCSDYRTWWLATHYATCPSLRYLPPPSNWDPNHWSLFCFNTSSFQYKCLYQYWIQGGGLGFVNPPPSPDIGGHFRLENYFWFSPPPLTNSWIHPSLQCLVAWSVPCHGFQSKDVCQSDEIDVVIILMKKLFFFSNLLFLLIVRLFISYFNVLSQIYSLWHHWPMTIS